MRPPVKTDGILAVTEVAAAPTRTVAPPTTVGVSLTCSVLVFKTGRRVAHDERPEANQVGVAIARVITLGRLVDVLVGHADAVASPRRDPPSTGLRGHGVICSTGTASRANGR